MTESTHATPRSDEHVERLASSVAKVRARSSKPPVERWLMLAGAVGLGLGLPVILLGWWGASRTPYVFEQIPYLISGGLLGLALVVGGGLAYFGYWLTRQVVETRRQSDRIVEALTRIERAVASGGMAGANGAALKPATGFLATMHGSMFHRRDCIVVVERDDVREVASTEGLQPCKVCDPLG